MKMCKRIFFNPTTAVQSDRLALSISQHVIFNILLNSIYLFLNSIVSIFAFEKSSQRITNVHLDIHVIGRRL